MFCRNGLQSISSIKNLLLLTLFSNEKWLLLRDLSPVVSRGCCSKLLTIHFKHGETATMVIVAETGLGILLRRGVQER